MSPVWLEQVGRHADAELAPVCAIVGGVVASEVIKVISGKGAPINNAFFFDALQTSEGAPPSLLASQPPSLPAAQPPSRLASQPPSHLAS